MEQQDDSLAKCTLRNRFAANAPLFLGIALIAGVVSLAWQLPDTRADRRHVERLKCEPVQRPPAVEAGSSWLPDNARVIGVTIGGRYRAYALRAFDLVDQHVLNDLLGNAAITVTYCPITGCIRVYTDPHGSRPLDVAVGGWIGNPGRAPGPDSVMLLRIESDYYRQDNGSAIEGQGKFPYRETGFEQTTWGEWRRAHPQTDVISGPEPGRTHSPPDR